MVIVTEEMEAGGGGKRKEGEIWRHLPCSAFEGAFGSGGLPSTSKLLFFSVAKSCIARALIKIKSLSYITDLLCTLKYGNYRKPSN